MRIHGRSVALAVVGLFVATAACTRSPPPLPPERRHVDTEFGFSFPLREGWTVDPQAVEAYRAFLAQAKARDAGGREVETNQREVVSVFKKDASGRVAGRLSVFVSETKPGELMRGYLESLGGPQVEVLEQKEGHEINGRTYDLTRLNVMMGPKKVSQEVFTTAAGNQALLFSLATADEATLAELKSIMWAVKWEKRQ